ncbi:MAG: YggS family pyridoxal phosphate-dependent enzyme [Chloroflexota bacterium]|nr:YggS family pyridoxal phosphate-dependent enzyme [Chloroflexota bacterium]
MDAAVAGPTSEVAARLAAVQEEITGAARRSGRDPSAVTLVAVSKTVPPERILPALEAGIVHLGENRVQEAEQKVPALPGHVRWHLVGHLQGNKISRALELFTLIHSVDRLELGRAIGERAQRQGRVAHVLAQVKLTDRETQFGFGEGDVGSAVLALADCGGLALDGLMCIAPKVENAAATRPYFRRLAGLFGDLAGEVQRAGHPWRHLSMGMTNDYAVAVEEGATLVRVGRAIFGERAPMPAE